MVALLPHDHQVLPDHHLLPLLPVPVQGVVVGNLGQRVRLNRHLHRYLLKLVRQQLREVVQEVLLPLEFAGEVLMCHSVQDLRREGMATPHIGEFIYLIVIPEILCAIIAKVVILLYYIAVLRFVVHLESRNYHT